MGVGNYRIHAKMAAGETAAGTFVVTGEPAIVEILGYAGFDFVIIDTEHSSNDIGKAENLIRAAELSGILPIVRVTENDPTFILKALDAGAAGILVPQVNSAQAAEAAVRAAKYGPRGDRGLAGIVRAARYGFEPLDDYLEKANKTLVIVQIEHIDAVRNLTSILEVPGVDGILIGPADLSQSMGLTGQFANPEFETTVDSIIQAGKACGKWVGAFCFDAADAGRRTQQGARLLAIATDTMLFAGAVRKLFADLQTIK